MEFPDDIQQLIRMFSRPYTRPDWRTCKRSESVNIQEANLYTCSFFEDLYQSRPELYNLTPGVFYEIPTWTLYSRISLIKILESIQNWFVFSYKKDSQTFQTLDWIHELAREL